MRLSLLSLFLIAAALLGELQAASAQSPTTYPWCSRYFGRGVGGKAASLIERNGLKFTQQSQLQNSPVTIGIAAVHDSQ